MPNLRVLRELATQPPRADRIFLAHTNFFLARNSNGTLSRSATALDCQSSSSTTKKIQRHSHCFFTPALLLRTPRPKPHLRELNTGAFSCTTRVAVINLLLDRTRTTRSNPCCVENFFREVFHAAKYFVLVCRLIYFLKFSFVQAPAPAKREALCTKKSFFNRNF